MQKAPFCLTNSDSFGHAHKSFADIALADECIFHIFFCFCLFPLGNALLELAHLSIYLLTKCSRSQSEEKFSIFRKKINFTDSAGKESIFVCIPIRHALYLVANQKAALSTSAS